MRILDRLVTSMYMRIFLAFALGAPVLFIVGDLTERLDGYIDRDLSMIEVATAYVYIYPKFVLWAFPVASLIAAVFTVQSLTVHREIMAAKAGGISFHRLMIPMLLMGFVLTGAGLWLSEQVPHTNRKASEILQNRDSRRDWRSNFVYRDDDGTTVAVQRLTVADGRIQDVVLERPPSEVTGLEAHLVADGADFTDDAGWTFENGYVRRLDAEGQELAFHFDELRTRIFTRRPYELLETPLHEDEMTYAHMGEMIEIIRDSGGDPREYEVLREQKVTVPVATFIVILFGAPLATTSKRGGPAFGMGVALGSAIIYMAILKVGAAFGAAGNISPMAAAWAPNVAFLVAGLGLMARVRT
jgi:lipopolysaccharide export system permease protein